VLDAGLADWLRAERIDLVLHLAWQFAPIHDRDRMRRIDVDGTLSVIRAAGEAGVDHVVYLSSTTAYGAHPTNPDRLVESHPTPGTTGFPYSADKAAVEQALDRLERELPQLGVTRVRPCIVLGQRTDNFVRAILDLPVLVRVAGHDPALQFLHEEDLASGLMRVLERRPGGAVNLAPEDSVTMTELGRLRRRRVLALPGALLRPAVALLWMARAFPVPAGYLDFITWPWLADTTRMRDELGFRPRHGTADAVRSLG